ncbi:MULTISPECIES: phosphoribosylanthranilate isomerase [unclassified Undibacterium]|uniref:phosphoribosylanthranilate isomerase n=1 Tax=unclassified Undibacterium TaxID=2630295 RepID=UPI002AC96498|nr:MULTISPECIES: phosphoribosylanthranilate isomerase [unclassified Undibacterium]MEB0138463.1 phosphoribosylanthranilate isomerase [Undibacterium sp. CCC2.1]MEB0173136.1 phosphoribosylanthranilate isomerase [Undibacterium sp. CCC1.1]MEB0177527.1 phosphoribosylanthranilate isomerase [Undibacterium sp. CCC3.4]MEB0216157.1 phosphoribosylanthranilate isomerase [Undibacterium sp. 5I2]WPX42794.1 phosphoribosylanthranilate isomerase [Undibacterium sp. CCC3.4]
MSHRTRIKICGLTRATDVALAAAAGADALGLVFYPPSPRAVTATGAARLLKDLPPFIVSVGLFVNPSAAELAAVLRQAPLQLLQFHGDETPQQAGDLAGAVARPFLKAFRVKPDTKAEDLIECELAYRRASPFFNGLLLDTFVAEYGGSGKVFDWSLIPKELAPRVVLSGGLSVHNVTGAVSQVRPFAVDISSGVEAAKGVKDESKLRAFIAAVRLADQRPAD